jgi:hypothetical protein
MGEMIPGMSTANACNFIWIIIKLGMVIRAGTRTYIAIDVTIVRDFFYWVLSYHS